MNAFASALGAILAALDRQETRYAIVGSVASSQHGMPRMTNDVDLLVDFSHMDLPQFASELAKEFYIDLAQARESIAQGRAFNAIHLQAGYKFDFFPLEGEFGEKQLQRRIFEASRTPQLENLEFAVASAEDTILAKLRWFRLTGETSERQWLDILGILRVQATTLDYAYLHHWAAELGLNQLLDRALSCAQPSPGPASSPSSGLAG